MDWNIAPECISIIMLLIVWVYSFKSGSAPSLKNKLFQTCFLVTFLAMASNIASTIMISYLSAFPLWLTWAVTTLYFICTPLMGLVYFLYSASVIFEKQGDVLKMMRYWLFPGIGYIVLIIINTFNRVIFDLDPVHGYSQGEYILVTYIIFYFYCLLSIFMATTNRKTVDKKIYRILSAFPLIAFGVIVFQQIYPTVMLSGTAATAALLIIYLHLQNKQISTDYLTDLANISEFYKGLDLLIKNGKESFTIAVISLREFKQVNAMYGQEIGDELLKSVANYLTSIHQRHEVYRFKGDEFAILFTKDERDLISSTLEDINKRFGNVWQMQNIDCQLDCVIGVVNYPLSANSAEQLINAVELAIAKAKKDNLSTCFCDDEMLKEIERKKKIQSILKEKYKSNDFDVFFQPIYSFEENAFLYAEALLRIRNSSIGALFPNEFIPIAEESGLIIEITYQVLDKVCKCINHLEEEGILIGSIHVNFSAIQFKEEDLAKKVIQIIDANKTAYSKIKIEVTESTIVDNTEGIVEFVKEMESYGVYMGLDDFGTGYSNMSSIVNIPFNTVKLDKSLVWAALEHESSAIMFKHLVTIFKELNMKVIAEGVETIEQNQFCKEHKIDQIQGFYYSKPVDETSYITFLKDKKTNM